MSAEHNAKQLKKAIRWLRKSSKRGYLIDLKHSRERHARMVDPPMPTKIRSVK